MARKKTSNIMKDHNEPLHDPPGMLPLSEVAHEAEKEHIIKILKSTNGNKTKAALVLRISRKTLWEKMKSYNIHEIM